MSLLFPEQIIAPIIYLITKGEATVANFDQKNREILDVIRLAVEEKVSLVQIREKKLPARLLFDLTVSAANVTRGSATRLLVNDWALVALGAGADGVHFSASAQQAKNIRDSFANAKDFIIGVSTHTVESALRASREGADFAVFGPVFETPGKDSQQGIEKLSEVCERLRPFPVLALGGIDEGNIASVLAAGAAGFAAIRSLNDPASLRSICRKLRDEG